MRTFALLNRIRTRCFAQGQRLQKFVAFCNHAEFKQAAYQVVFSLFVLAGSYQDVWIKMFRLLLTIRIRTTGNEGRILKFHFIVCLYLRITNLSNSGGIRIGKFPF